MFSVKGRHYKVEYEGLHLLCLSCGRFGHSTRGCPDTKVLQSDVKERRGTEGKSQGVHNEDDGVKAYGTWMVVQKTRRMRKQKFELGKEVIEIDEASIIVKNKGNTYEVGSRFQALSGIITNADEDKEPEAQPTLPAKDPLRAAADAKVVERLLINHQYGGNSKMRRATVKEHKKIKKISTVAVRGIQKVNGKGVSKGKRV